jgi:hypothetical protein
VVRPLELASPLYILQQLLRFHQRQLEPPRCSSILLSSLMVLPMGPLQISMRKRLVSYLPGYPPLREADSLALRKLIVLKLMILVLFVPSLH